MSLADAPDNTAQEQPGLRERVGAEQVRVLYASAVGMYATLFAAIAISGLFVWLGVLKAWIAVIWLGVMVIHMAVRLVVRRAYQRSTTAMSEWRSWAVRHTAGAGIAGLTWGIGGAVIMPAGRFDLQMLLILAITSLIYATLSAFGSWFPAFLTFAATALVPLAIWGALQGDALHVTFTVCCVIWLPAIAFMARRHEQTLVNSFTLQFENAALADDLRAQKVMAEQANVAKSRFLASASHDLRQPVHALGMFVGALRGHRLEARSLALIDQVDASVAALDGLFTSLLDISRLDADGVQSKPADIAVQPLLDRVCRDLAAEAEAKGIELMLAPTRVAVRSDPLLLERVMRNLIGNAVRYTETGSVLVGVRRKAGPAGPDISLEVWDTGPGIAPEQQGAVFEEFYQVANPDRDRTKGLGLGLPIVLRLTGILDHGLEMSSEVGKGTVFRVRAPRAAAADAVDHEAAERAAAAPVAGVVLAIDDEQAIRQAMRELLTSWGHEVIAVGSGSAALQAVADGARPDLIICDFRLRDGESGIGVIGALRAALGGDTPAILLTGDTAPENLRLAMASGYPLLHKPLAHAKLRAAVGNLMRRPRGPRTTPRVPAG